VWRYDGQKRTAYTAGKEPFRARGLAYASAMKYVDSKLSGGRRAFADALGANDDPAFYEQIFVVAGDYDITPLVRLFAVVAALERTPIADFIEAAARWSGSSDSKGIWKPSLHGETPQRVAAKLHFAFNRYFPPCSAQPVQSEERSFIGDLSMIPVCMDGLYAASTLGFYRGALDAVGAKDVRIDWAKPASMGTHEGVPIERLRFTASW
jgi:hypothetical protein